MGQRQGMTHTHQRLASHQSRPFPSDGNPSGARDSLGSFPPPDRPGLRGTDEIAKLNEAVGRSLCLELDKTHRYPVKGDVTVYAFLIAKMPALR